MGRAFVEFRLFDEDYWVCRRKTSQQVLWTLIDEIPAEMREGDDRVRKLHEALVRLRVEFRLGGRL